MPFIIPHEPLCITPTFTLMKGLRVEHLGWIRMELLSRGPQKSNDGKSQPHPIQGGKVPGPQTKIRKSIE